MGFLYIILSFFGTSVLTHEVPIAIFRIYEENQVLLMEVTLDQQDLRNELVIEDETINTSLIQNYLNEKTEFFFDSRKSNYKIMKLQFENDHIRISGKFSNVQPDFKKIELYNTCLNSIDSHSNIIRLELRNQERGFRMHKKRQNINIDY